MKEIARDVFLAGCRAQDSPPPVSKGCNFQLYGFDFVFSEDVTQPSAPWGVWLLEVNRAPSMEAATPMKGRSTSADHRLSQCTTR
jgi:hypothetical protein